MSKMNELSQTIDDLIACGQGLINAATALRACFSAEPEPLATEVPAAEPAKVYSFVDIRKAAAAKSHDGYTDAVRSLITKYGADRLSGIQETDYAAFMADLEAIA